MMHKYVIRSTANMVRAEFIESIGKKFYPEYTDWAVDTDGPSVRFYCGYRCLGEVHLINKSDVLEV